MYPIVYTVVCISLANLLYKSQANKHKIATQPVYAIFVGVWMCLFALLFFIPSWSVLPIIYSVMPIFLFTTILWFAFPWIVRRYGHAPTHRMTASSPNFLLYFTPSIMVTKYFEILCQQGLFVYVLFIVLQGQSNPTKVLWFFIFNLGIHLANLLFMEKKETIFFVYWSIPMGFIFGYLLLNGYIFLTSSMHMLFYLIVNGSLWIKKRNI